MEFESAFSAKAATWSNGSQAKDIAPASVEWNGRSRGVTWLALTVKDAELAKQTLEAQFGFHPVAVDDALSEWERPGVHIADDHVFATLPVIEASGRDVVFRHLGLFVGRRTLVSVTVDGCHFVEEWFHRWKAQPAKVGPTPDMLMQELFDAAIDDYFPALDDIQSEVDKLEELIYQNAQLNVASAISLRRRLLEMRRQVGPIRDVLNAMLRRDTPVVGDETRTYLQDVYDHSLRVLEAIDLNRDILSSMMDAQLSVTSNRLNEVMRNMTTLATILMLMSLIAGIYGMNFRHMPELEWEYGYYVVWGVLLVVFFGGMGIATKIGWFKVRWPWAKKPDSLALTDANGRAREE